MSFDRGGRAAKLGHRYEDRWIIKNFLDLLDEHITGVTIEALGEDEKGVDLWVIDKKGKRRAYQCKARNTGSDHWTAGDLHTKGIFKKARLQLDRGGDTEYHFVSDVAATQVKDICNKARNSGDWESFYKYQIKTSQKQKHQLTTICRGFELSADIEDDIEKAYYYLQRIFFNQYPDDHLNKTDLLYRISYLIEGNAESIYSLLINFAVENDRLGREINAHELWSFLENNSCRPKRLDKDNRIIPAVKAQQKRYEESIKKQGFIGGKRNN
jgi:hypothetical protein